MIYLVYFLKLYIFLCKCIKYFQIICENIMAEANQIYNNYKL